MDDRKWHWQDPGTAWKGMGIYHVTMVVPSRAPLLGKLVIPDNNPEKAYVEHNEMGTRLIKMLLNNQNYYPEVRVLQFCVMPDHLHAILQVMRPMDKTFNTVVRSIWQGAKKIGRSAFSSISPESHSGIFTEHPFVRPMSRRGQLQTMIQYVQMNPQRLATKHLMPEYFWVQEGIQIAGRTYCAVGNAKLLQAAHMQPVHVRSMWVKDAEQHGYDQPLRDYKNGCVKAAREGAVMVSPFINEHERAVLDYLLQDKRPIIYIADNGFGKYYKPPLPSLMPSPKGVYSSSPHGRTILRRKTSPVPSALR